MSGSVMEFRDWIGVVCGGRNKADQNSAYRAGNSLAKWGESDHNFLKGDKMCSLAVDIAPYSARLKDYVWDDLKMWASVVRAIYRAARELGVQIGWGGDFKTIVDKPHFYLVI